MKKHRKEQFFLNTLLSFSTSSYPRTVTERGQCVVNAKSLDENRVAVRSMANLKRIRVWNVDTLKEEMAFDHKTDLLDFDVSVDGEYIVSCDIEGNLSCLNVHDMVSVGTFLSF